MNKPLRVRMHLVRLDIYILAVLVQHCLIIYWRVAMAVRSLFALRIQIKPVIKSRESKIS